MPARTSTEPSGSSRTKADDGMRTVGWVDVAMPMPISTAPFYIERGLGVRRP